jgi:hypothetical protein
MGPNVSPDNAFLQFWCASHASGAVVVSCGYYTSSCASDTICSFFFHVRGPGQRVSPSLGYFCIATGEQVNYVYHVRESFTNTQTP